MHRSLLAPLLCLPALTAACATGHHHPAREGAEQRSVRHAVEGAFERVEVRGAACDLDLRVEAVDAPSVVSHQVFSVGREPRVRVEVVDGTLFCEVEAADGVGTSYADFEVVLPVGPVRLEVVTGSGDVVVRGLVGHARVEATAGDVELSNVDLVEGTVETGAGDIELSGSVESLSVSASAGDVELALRAVRELRVGAGAGDVEVHFDQRPERVEVTTGAGDVRLVLPRGAYAVDAASSAGDLSLSGVQSDGAASSRIVVRAGAGDVRLRAAD